VARNGRKVALEGREEGGEVGEEGGAGLRNVVRQSIATVAREDGSAPRLDRSARQTPWRGRGLQRRVSDYLRGSSTAQTHSSDPAPAPPSPLPPRLRRRRCECPYPSREQHWRMQGNLLGEAVSVSPRDKDAHNSPSGSTVGSVASEICKRDAVR
jgi:hypothetical protein